MIGLVICNHSSHLRKLDDIGYIGSDIHFKINNIGNGESTANTVADILNCGTPATRLFHCADEHKARHENFGLHRWYVVACDSAATETIAEKADVISDLVTVIAPSLLLHPVSRLQHVPLSTNGVQVVGATNFIDQIGKSATNGVRRFGTDSFLQSGKIAKAIVNAADNGSLVSSHHWIHPVPGEHVEVVRDAMSYFRSTGGVVVVAAGDDGRDGQIYPGNYDSTLAVAAVDTSHKRVPSSNHGRWIDLSVIATTTSMACLAVTTTLTLGLHYARNLGNSVVTMRDVETCLLETATELVGKRKKDRLGAGLMNASAMLECVSVMANNCDDVQSVKHMSPEVFTPYWI